MKKMHIERASKRLKPASSAMRARAAKYRKTATQAVQGMGARVRKAMRGM